MFLSSKQTTSFEALTPRHLVTPQMVWTHTEMSYTREESMYAR